MINEFIENSHKRSLEYGVNPEEKLSPEKSKQKLTTSQNEWVQIAKSYGKDLLKHLGEDSDYILLITDNTGLILESFGSEKAVKHAFELNLRQGVDMSERSVGTNAIGTAIKECRPVQVSGKEHFVKALQVWACSASPVFDIDGSMLGTINITAKKELFHKHTLGLVTASARAIENKIHNSNILNQLYEAQHYSFNIMNNLSFGLIANEIDGTIRWINDTACRSLNIRRSNLIKTHISNIYAEWKSLQNDLFKGKVIQDMEADFKTDVRHEKYLINAYLIANEMGEKIGFTITFRPFSRMLSLINKYSGRRLSFSFDKIIYKSKKMKELVDYAQNIANSPSTILITGESGTGKEVFAQAIHNASQRRNGGFIAINCGAISPTLIESELFGYEEGAFTGAQKGGRIGKIEMSHNGTLFLDEIGEMPLDMQVKLLRALQEKAIVRVGGSQVQNVDIRVIAATNKELEEQVEKGKFRQDLYYRLNVIPLHLPSLRERKADIIPTFRALLKRKANELDRPLPQINSKDEKKLLEHNWPGNVRELENFAEKTIILQGKPNDFVQKTSDEATNPLNMAIKMNDSGELPKLETIEKNTIIQYLDILDGNISKVAKSLGIGRNTLYLKMRKYRIEHQSN